MKRFAAILWVLSLALYSQAEKVSYVSSVDQDLSLKTLVVSPFADNVGGIYANPVTNKVLEQLRSDARFITLDKVVTPPAGIDALKSAEDMQDHPADVKKFLSDLRVDGLVTGRVKKMGSDVQVEMYIFTVSNGYSTWQEAQLKKDIFETDNVVSLSAETLNSLFQKIPYQSTVQGRKGNLVTLNIGRKFGLTEGVELNVIQITRVERHPRFHFLTSLDKEILGKVKVQKVDEYLSFASVVSERESGVVKAGQKLELIQFLQRPAYSTSADGKIVDRPFERQDQKLGVGDNAKEWIPAKAPTFGLVGVGLGMGPYTLNADLGSAGAPEVSSFFVPSISVHGEMWLNTRWFVSGRLRQFVTNQPNPLSGSTPSSLNISTQMMELYGGYNFLIAEDFFGPKIQLKAGFSKLSVTADTSTPLAFTSTAYSAMNFAVGGSFPLGPEYPYILGSELIYSWQPSLTETPQTSGASSTNTMVGFNAYGLYVYTQSLRLRGQVDFQLTSSSFSGAGTRTSSASSISLKTTTFTAGVEVLF